MEFGGNRGPWGRLVYRSSVSTVDSGLHSARLGTRHRSRRAPVPGITGIAGPGAGARRSWSLADFGFGLRALISDSNVDLILHQKPSKGRLSRLRISFFRGHAAQNRSAKGRDGRRAYHRIKLLPVVARLWGVAAQNANRVPVSPPPPSAVRPPASRSQCTLPHVRITCTDGSARTRPRSVAPVSFSGHHLPLRGCSSRVGWRASTAFF